MSSLVKIRSERDQMSAIERRIADFLLDNAHLLRDYSSQQLASALDISQSSVVKFSQKLGFKGYPDLKFSIGEALARTNGDVDAPTTNEELADEGMLWRLKHAAREETVLINPRENLEAGIDVLVRASQVMLYGHGEDGLQAAGFAARLAQLGITAIAHSDPRLMLAGLATLKRGDVLLVVSEHGAQPEVAQAGRIMHTGGGRLVSITRHTANPIRAHADLALLVSAHDGDPHLQALAYRTALLHLLDLLFLGLWRERRSHREHYEQSRERLLELDGT